MSNSVSCDRCGKSTIPWPSQRVPKNWSEVVVDGIKHDLCEDCAELTKGVIEYRYRLEED
jgi:hypothetical protein